MKGLIILDGPDAVGKSTLAAKFKELHGARVIHLTYRFKDHMFTYQTAALRLALRLADTQLVVIDRHWPSECVYGSVFRGGSKWPQAGRFYDRVLLKHGALHILCLPESVEAAVETHKANLDPDHPYDDIDFRNVVQRYLHFGHGYKNTYDLKAAPHLPDYCHDFATCGGVFKERSDWIQYRIGIEGKDLTGFCNETLAKLHIQRALQPQSALQFKHQNWAGSVSTAKWVIIGEDHTPFRAVRWPFYAYGNSSLHLTDTLASLGVMEHDLVWLNCNEDLTVFDEAFSRIRQLPVLALGGEATAFAMKQGFKKVINCNTPEYALRWKKKLKLPFQEQLARGIRQ